MATVPVKAQGFTEVTLLRLAREIAMDIHPVTDILARHDISVEEFNRIRQLPHFNQLLRDAVETWQSALNTNERVKTKAAAMMEEWLPELNTRIHDRSESLLAKIKAGELAARLAGMGLRDAHIEGDTGSKFSVVINLGADKQIAINKEIAPRIIEQNSTG